jgi:hypothetical protein
MQIVTTSQADQIGIVIVEPLTIVDTVAGPYLITGDYNIVAPTELGDNSAIKQVDLDRWAGSRGYVREGGTNMYRPR